MSEMSPLEQTLRSFIADLDYDIHKSIECGEDDGLDRYPQTIKSFADTLRGLEDAQNPSLAEAREDLFSVGSQDMPVGGDEVREAMAKFELAVRIDQRRQDAARIRNELPERVRKLVGNWAEIRTISTAQHAADLIDPDRS